MPYHARVAHHVRGRLRVRVPAGRGNPQVLSEIAEALTGKAGIRTLECNVRTGSIVVHYDADRHEDFRSQLADHGESTGVFALAPPEVPEIDQLVESIEQEAEFLAQHSETARAIVNTVRALNGHLRRATNNNVDLKVLLPLGLAAWALIEHDPEITTPLWLTLGITSFNSFVALHPPLPSVAVHAQEFIAQGGGPESTNTRLGPVKPLRS